MVLDAAARGLAAAQAARRAFIAGRMEFGFEFHAPGMAQGLVEPQHQRGQFPTLRHDAELQRGRGAAVRRRRREFDGHGPVAVRPGHASVGGDHVGPGTGPGAVRRQGEIADDVVGRRIVAENRAGGRRGWFRRGSLSDRAHPVIPFPPAPRMVDVVDQQISQRLLFGRRHARAGFGRPAEQGTPVCRQPRAVGHPGLVAGPQAAPVEGFAAIDAFELAVDAQAAQILGAARPAFAAFVFGRNQAPAARAAFRRLRRNFQNEAGAPAGGIADVGTFQAELRFDGAAVDLGVDAAEIRALRGASAGSQAAFVRAAEVARVGGTEVEMDVRQVGRQQAAFVQQHVEPIQHLEPLGNAGLHGLRKSPTPVAPRLQNERQRNARLRQPADFVRRQGAGPGRRLVDPGGKRRRGGIPARLAEFHVLLRRIDRRDGNAGLQPAVFIQPGFAAGAIDHARQMHEPAIGRKRIARDLLRFAAGHEKCQLAVAQRETDESILEGGAPDVLVAADVVELDPQRKRVGRAQLGPFRRRGHVGLGAAVEPPRASEPAGAAFGAGAQDVAAPDPFHRPRLVERHQENQPVPAGQRLAGFVGVELGFDGRQFEKQAIGAIHERRRAAQGEDQDDFRPAPQAVSAGHRGGPGKRSGNAGAPARRVPPAVRARPPSGRRTRTDSWRCRRGRRRFPAGAGAAGL